VEYVRFQPHDGVHWIHADAYAAVVLTPSAAPKVFCLGNAQKLEAEPVVAYRRGCGPQPRHFPSAAKTLRRRLREPAWAAAYAAFWKPIESSLGSATRVYVAADGILNQVPMGLFTDPSGKLLLEKYDLRAVNSTKDLLRPRRSAGAGKTAWCWATRPSI